MNPQPKAQSPRDSARRVGVVIPACNEEACLAATLRELREILSAERFPIAVGVNGSSDRTAEIARQGGALCAETPLRGYGYGCQAAVELLETSGSGVAAYVFFAADGANDPRDIPKLVAGWEDGAEVVLGRRTFLHRNLAAMGAVHMCANALLGLWTGLLTGRFFWDLGPHRLISREIFHQMRLSERTYGWTIEAQIRAAQLGARIREIPVAERRRSAGEQKVSRVHWRHSLAVGLEIFRSGWRVAGRERYPVPARELACEP